MTTTIILPTQAEGPTLYSGDQPPGRGNPEENPTGDRGIYSDTTREKPILPTRLQVSLATAWAEGSHKEMAHVVAA